MNRRPLGPQPKHTTAKCTRTRPMRPLLGTHRTDRTMRPVPKRYRAPVEVFREAPGRDGCRSSECSRMSPDPFDQLQQLCASPIVKNTKAKNVALRTTERLTWARTMSADCPRDMASWRPAAQSPICSQIHTRRCSHPRMQDGIDDPGPRLASRSGGPRGLGWGFRRAVRGTPAGTVRGLRCSRRNRRSPTRSHTCHSSRS